MNAELCRRALERVGGPNILINIVSQRVRQLNAGGGGLGRPLIADYVTLGAADIALREVIEEKIGWELPKLEELTRPLPKKRRR
ncbi:MAG TPA: DNA-directed RNA polymerase subunit omega [Verrucomicrobiota bacterium]|nr:DNA-directed RNA polymerase subunit omega [Verrucomicrobiota bacterium]HNT16055.1 DNA-directed RNA polymerase subunit omega [Verrucomicrobiota bacterium]